MKKTYEEKAVADLGGGGLGGLKPPPPLGYQVKI